MKSYTSKYIKILIALILIFSFVLQGKNIPSDEIWLIVRGDDIGLAHGANAGFIKSREDGILSSAELMVPTPWFNEGVKILNNHPNLEAGVHLTLTSEWSDFRWGPISPLDSSASIVDKDGYFYYRTETAEKFDKIYGDNYSFLGSDPDLEEIKTEVRYQIEKAVEKVPSINHISCHMRAASATPEIRKVVQEVSNQYNLVPDWLIREYGKEISLWSVPIDRKEEALINKIKKMEGGNLYYLPLHPGLDTPEMENISGPAFPQDKNMSEHRAAVTKALTSEEVKDLIEKRNIKIVDHKYIIQKGIISDLSKYKSK